MLSAKDVVVVVVCYRCSVCPVSSEVRCAFVISESTTGILEDIPGAIFFDKTVIDGTAAVVEFGDFVTIGWCFFCWVNSCTA